MRRGRASSSEETKGIWQERELEKDFVSTKSSESVSNLCNGQCQWAGNMSDGECCFGFSQRVCPLFPRIQHERGPTRSLELHGKRGSRKDPKYPKRILVGETLGPWRGG